MQLENKAQKGISSKFSPEVMSIVKDLAETVKPLLDEVHNQPKVSKNYYAEYMSILGRLIKSYPNPRGRLKLMAIVFLYVGCNPNGVEEAVKLLSN